MTYAPHVIGSIVKFFVFFCVSVYDETAVVMLKLNETFCAELYVKLIEAQFDVTSHARAKICHQLFRNSIFVLCMMKHFSDQNSSNR